MKRLPVKKAILSIEFFVKLILFLIVFSLIVVPLGLKIYDFLAGKPNTSTNNSQQLLIKEVYHMAPDTSATIPVYVDKKHLLKAFSYDAEDLPGECDEKSCLCICDSSGCDENIDTCSELSHESTDDGLIIENFVIEAEEQVRNIEVRLISTGEGLRLSLN